MMTKEEAQELMLRAQELMLELRGAVGRLRVPMTNAELQLLLVNEKLGKLAVLLGLNYEEDWAAYQLSLKQ